MVDAMTPIDWTKPADEILAELLADVWVPTDAAITGSEIVKAVGTDAARLVVGTLQAGASVDPLLALSFTAVATLGMSLSPADRQEMIDQLAVAGEWPDAVRDGVKALGGVWVGRWSLEGFEAEPTLSQVEGRKAEKLEDIHRQKARLAGVRFGEQFAIGGDAGEAMDAIWEAI